MKKILVPVDLSGATVRICNVAAELAKAVDGRLVILHVVPPPPMVMSEYYAFDASQMIGLTSEARKRAAHRMEALGRWFSKRCPATKVVMHEGDPVSVILRTAATVRPDYLVLGSHGHTAAYDLIIGSTTHGIIRKPPCPLVLVPIAQPTRKDR